MVGDFNMRIKTIAALVITIALLASCNVLFSNYKGEGNITISLGEESGKGKWAAPTNLPAFSEVIVRAKKGGITVAEQSFSGHGPFTFMIPGGSGYTIEVEATPLPVMYTPSGWTVETERPFSFAKKFGGTAKDVNSQSGTVTIRLSILSSYIVQVDGTVYKNFGDKTAVFDFISPSPSGDAIATDKGVFYDQYGRFYYGISDSNASMKSIPFPSDESTAEIETSSIAMANIYNVAHAPGSEYCYFVYGSEIQRLKLFNFDTATTSSLSTGFVPYTNYDALSTSKNKIAVDFEGNFFMVGYNSTQSQPCLVWGKINETSSNVTYDLSSVRAITCPTELYPDTGLLDFKAINGTLYALSRDGSEVWLYALGNDLVVKPISRICNDADAWSKAIFSVMDKDVLYISYYWDDSMGSTIVKRIHEYNIATNTLRSVTVD